MQAKASTTDVERRAAKAQTSAAPFISVAFVATVVFVPLVVSVGLATGTSRPADPQASQALPAGVADLRGSLETEPLRLRGSD